MQFVGVANGRSRGAFCRLIGNLFGCGDSSENFVQASDSAGVGQQFYAIFETPLASEFRRRESSKAKV